MRSFCELGTCPSGTWGKKLLPVSKGTAATPSRGWTWGTRWRSSPGIWGMSPWRWPGQGRREHLPPSWALQAGTSVSQRTGAGCRGGAGPPAPRGPLPQEAALLAPHVTAPWRGTRMCVGLRAAPGSPRARHWFGQPPLDSLGHGCRTRGQLPLHLLRARPPREAGRAAARPPSPLLGEGAEPRRDER